MSYEKDIEKGINHFKKLYKTKKGKNLVLIAFVCFLAGVAYKLVLLALLIMGISYLIVKNKGENNGTKNKSKV